MSSNIQDTTLSSNKRQPTSESSGQQDGVEPSSLSAEDERNQDREELRDLLLTCFPDIRTKELDEALAFAEGNSEVAVDHLLNLAFLADEFSTASSPTREETDEGNENDKEEEFPALPTSVSKPDPDLDLAIALSLASVKEGDGSGEPISAASAQKPTKSSHPSRVIPHVQGYPSFGSGSGAWRDKEILIQQLSHAFPSIPRPQVAEAVREAQGNVDMAIDILETAPPPWGAEHDEALTQMSSIFPEHTVEDLASLIGSLPLGELEVDRMVDRVLTGQVGAHPTKTSESADFWMAHRCQRETNDMWSGEKGKGKSTGIQPQSLPAPPPSSTHKVIPFSKTKVDQGEWTVQVGRSMGRKEKTSESNTSGDGRVYDVEECRQQASLAASRRNQAYRAAARAFRSAPRGGRMGEAAAYYASEARRHDASVRQWHSMATQVILDRQGPSHALQAQGMEVIRVDLHGLTVPEACASALTAANSWWDRECTSGSARRPRSLRLITGLGKHSKGGRSKLQPAVEAALRRDGWTSRREGGAILLEGSMQKG
ncbi:hypothetical protein BJ684DRAFT_19820 [Piptocephalis cylindrospora]|uniref:Smr domain-containing protein n=1 Tax=Piptocephalis cylindrospora TaxID=1907219 RepID=A0A4P9Y422_9FUNG|nr:hypothetical protein BJ684DRAFT_19820 [Piptocephalis cylindrospora]|eukprot:RKP13718.1 hypothetical protein BJ684DRAFT_19820 [Piptocephalis cylindrospora]